MIAGLIALALHAAVVITPNVTSEPEVVFKKGESSIEMHLVPSVASVASRKPVKDSKRPHEVEKETVEVPKPLQKPERQKAEPVAISNPVNEIKKPLHTLEEKALDTLQPLQKPKKSIEKQVKVEADIVQKPKEIAYSAKYFKPDNTAKDKPVPKQSKSTNNSKEIIADVKVKGVTTGAMVKNVFKPSYPLSCKRQGHEGTTILEVTILSNGKRGNIDIVKSAGCKSLDKAAIKALKKAKYIPAKRIGVPFTASKKIVFHFKLEDS
ncbi:MAG: TonB family protein [Planctomycetes bacterium]|nr:TonB family protein [Planctomycetota bacterium]